ncbi:MAG: B12-binding domain-containing radical SAM protein [Polyangiaceae bacterium]|nr:B12-binding domain-containing radical SAM protein [Polyangiaceae bacterium]
MRVALIYPPPWRIPSPGEPADRRDGPPPDFDDSDLDADFYQIPYGLLSLAAQARAFGHQVKVVNLASYPWRDVEHVVRKLQADVYGLSCWTANRRGVALVATAIRKQHPRAHLSVGGPHATALARELLARHTAVDSVVLGEAEVTFIELLERLGNRRPLAGMAGAVVRSGGRITSGPPRPAMTDLDDLACPHRDFTTHIVMTSRGCPFDCTFCAARTTWGRGYREHSVRYVLDMLELALARVPVKMLQLKDDTFTAHRSRALRICRGIRDRRLDFLWSCDTRADVLDEELLREMRLAGCERLSLGVESGSDLVLRNINKRLTVAQVLEATELAKRCGIRVRYYMMLGNRGETATSFGETLELLDQAQPHEYIFSCLSIYPGTADFRDAAAAGRVDSGDYFRGRFQELKTPFDASEADVRVINDWFVSHRGLRRLYQPSVEDCRAVVSRLGDHHAAHLDLAAALYRAARLEEARHHAQLALKLEHPTPGLVYNLLACIAYARNELEHMKDLFVQAGRRDPQHAVLVGNAQATRRWLARAEAGKEPLVLDPSHDFQLLERTVQPCLPGPLDADFADW